MSGTQGGFRPKSLPTNPGYGGSVEAAFANAERSWSEQADVVELLAEVMRAHDYFVEVIEGTWIEHPRSGYVILPQISGLQPLDKGGVRTTTTIQVHHPALVPEGLFEYQHSAGDDTSDSIRKGFDQWVQVDLVTLLDAALAEPEFCMRMVLELPAKDGRPAKTRRAILGPIAHYQARPPGPGTDEGSTEGGESHSYCPCCLLTRSFEAFKGHFENDGFFGLRLFALRDAEGSPLADCRVNGEDFEAGANGLRIYATTWPEAGYEFRKQYVILQTIEPDLGKGAASE